MPSLRLVEDGETKLSDYEILSGLIEALRLAQGTGVPSHVKRLMEGTEELVGRYAEKAHWQERV